jgi:hypothetical protein
MDIRTAPKLSNADTPRKNNAVSFCESFEIEIDLQFEHVFSNF